MTHTYYAYKEKRIKFLVERYEDDIFVHSQTDMCKDIKMLFGS